VVPIQVKGLVLDSHTKTPVLILKETDGERILPIWIGEEEAFSISIALTENTSPRPLTHDLIAILIPGLKSSLSKVVIDRIENNTYYSYMIIDRDHEILKIDSRPSDAVAVALRLQAPIYVEECIMKSVEPYFPETLANEKSNLEKLKNRLKNMEPEDFGNNPI